MYKEALLQLKAMWQSTGRPSSPRKSYNVTILGFGACVLYSSDLNYKDEYENKSVQSLKITFFCNDF